MVGRQRQIQDLVNHLRDATLPGIEGPEAHNAVAITRALYASAASGQPVTTA